MKLFKQIIIVIILLFEAGCIQESKIKVTLYDSPKKITVSNIQVVNHQLIITGKNLNNVSTFKIKEGATTTLLAIESKTTNSLVANTLSNVTFAAGRVFSFILSDANAASTFTVNFSLCDSTLGGKGFNCLVVPNDKDVMSFDAATDKWIPRNVNGLNYKGTFSALPGADPLGAPLAGDYYIISAAGTINAETYLVGDWIVYNSDDLAWQKVSNSKDVLTVFGRTGKISAKKGDYTLTQMANVDLLTTPPVATQVLQYNGTNWVPATVAGGGGSVTAVSSANADIAVATGTTTPVLTLNSGTSVGQILKFSVNNQLPALDGSLLTSIAPANLAVAVPMSKGGSGATMTPVNGGVVYSNATTMDVTAAGTAGQILRSTGASAPAWSTATYPATVGVNNLLFGTSANVVGEIATANSSILATNASGVPSWSTVASTKTLLGYGTAANLDSGELDGKVPVFGANATVGSMCTFDAILGFICNTAIPSGGSLSGLTAATAINTIDNLNFAQSWNWSTATTESAMSIAANALTTGSLLNLSTSNATVNSTNGLLNVANSGASTTGILARFQSNSTAGSGLTILTNGNVGIGTTNASSPLTMFGAKDGALADFTNFNSTIGARTELTGTQGLAQHGTSSPVTTAKGISGFVYNGLTGTITEGMGLSGDVTNLISGTISSAYGGKFKVTRTGGTITNAYGVYTDTIQGTNKWSMYASDATAPSYFAGNVGIGASSANATLDVRGSLSVGGTITGTNNGLGLNSSALGSGLNVSGTNSFGTGMGGTASGSTSFAANYLTQAIGNMSAAFGEWTYASSRNEFAVGSYNIILGGDATTYVGTNAVFTVGNGTGTGARSNAMTILKNGKTGLGVSAPTEILDVAGNIKTSGCLYYASSSLGVCASDVRLKKDIHSFDLGLEALLGLRPVNFKYNGLAGFISDGKVQLGVIAQDVEKIAPELVKRQMVQLHKDDSDKTEIKVVDYGAFTYVIINAIKDLYHKWFDDSAAIHREIASVKLENAELKKEIEAIKIQLREDHASQRSRIKTKKEL